MLRVFSWSLVALALRAAPALAQEPHPKDPDILSPRFDLTIWSIVIFALLFLVLKKYSWGPILEGLQARERNIESAIEEAVRAREEMSKQQAEFQKQLNDANQQIPKLMEQARKDAEVLKEEMRTQANADIQTERQRLRREIDVAKDQALQEIWQQAANLATVISAQAIRRQISPEDHRRLIDEALAEVNELTKAQPGKSGEVGTEWIRQAGGRI